MRIMNKDPSPTRVQTVGNKYKPSLSDSVVEKVTYPRDEKIGCSRKGDKTTVNIEHLENPRSLLNKDSEGFILGHTERGGILKFEKVKKGIPLCILRRDVTCDMVEELLERDLIGRSNYIKLTRFKILE